MLLKLPQDVLCYVLEYLPLSELTRMMLVCQQLRHLIKSHHKWPITIRPGNLTQAILLLTHFNFARYDFSWLQQWGLSQKQLPLLAKIEQVVFPRGYFPTPQEMSHLINCQTIYLKGNGGNNPPLIDIIPDRSDVVYLPRCRSVEIVGHNITDRVLRYFSHCTEVMLDYCPQITGQGFSYLSNCTKLTLVEINSADNIDSRHFGYLTRLQRLEIIKWLNTAPDLRYLPEDTNIEVLYKSYAKRETLAYLAERDNVRMICVNNIVEAIDQDLIYLSKLSRVELSYVDITGEGFQYLSNCTRLQLVQCNDIDKSNLAHLKQCHSFYFRECSSIDDDSLSYLSHCTSLFLDRCPVKGDGLKYLTNCQSLILDIQDLSSDMINDFSVINDEQLQYLSNCLYFELRGYHSITGAGFQYLTNCQRIVLYECFALFEDHLVHLRSCPNIQILNCPGITQHGLKYLSHCHSVKLEGFRSVDEGLANLANCHTVQLYHCQVTNVGLAHLARCTKLALVDCNHITDQGLMGLRCLYFGLANCGRITDVGLAHLAHCRVIGLDYPSVSGKMIRWLMNKGVKFVPLLNSREGPMYSWDFTL